MSKNFFGDLFYESLQEDGIKSFNGDYGKKQKKKKKKKKKKVTHKNYKKWLKEYYAKEKERKELTFWEFDSKTKNKFWNSLGQFAGSMFMYFFKKWVDSQFDSKKYRYLPPPKNHSSKNNDIYYTHFIEKDKGDRNDK